MVKPNSAADANSNLTNNTSYRKEGFTWKITEQQLNTFESDNYKSGESHTYCDYNNPETLRSTGDSTHYYSHSISGTNDMEVDNGDYTVYPNPNSGQFSIFSESIITRLEIYNSIGERIHYDPDIQPQSAIYIDLTGHGPGIYFINIYDGALKYVRKVIVQ